MVINYKIPYNPWVRGNFLVKGSQLLLDVHITFNIQGINNMSIPITNNQQGHFYGHRINKINIFHGTNFSTFDRVRSMEWVLPNT